MACDRYLELLSARLDGALTPEEGRELEEHLLTCPDCRAVGAQLSALRGAFPELEEVPAPEGFAQGVMDRIRAEEPKKVIPLFKRPQFRALAGLAACLVVVVGLYGASRPRHLDKTAKMDMTARSFNRDALTQETDGAAGLEEAPQVAAYAAPEGADYDAESKMSPDVEAVDGLPVERLCDSAIMVLERMPRGAEELIPPETAVTYNVLTGEEGYRWLDVQGEPEALAEIAQLAAEQGMCVERCSLPAEELLYDLVILQPDK